MEDKTRGATESQSIEATPPPLLVTLVSDHLGKLPSGLKCRFPHEVAINLILHKYAVPVADFNSRPDLEIAEEQLMYSDLPSCVLPLQAILETDVEAA